MSDVLTGQIRSDFGKGAARRVRREGNVPAVIYGHGSVPIHIVIDAHELILMLRRHVTSLDIKVDGKVYSVAPRDIQIDPVRRHVEHLDLVVVTAAEAATIAREAAEAHAKAEASAEAAATQAAAKADARAARIADGTERPEGSEESGEAPSESAG